MTFSLVLWHELSDEINRLPEKTRRIIKSALKRLEEDPFPGSKGDKEKLVLKGGVIIYRLPIPEGIPFFMRSIRMKNSLIVQEILPIGQTHKKYGQEERTVAV